MLSKSPHPELCPLTDIETASEADVVRIDPVGNHTFGTGKDATETSTDAVSVISERKFDTVTEKECRYPGTIKQEGTIINPGIE
jgi:hypothetical protein